MLNRWKRLLALLASVAVLFSLCTAASAAPGEQAEPRELTAADYAAADAIFASLPSANGTNGGTAGAADTGALCNWLETADGVRPGTVSANGSCVTWQTDAGITCSYNPQLEHISECAQEPAQTETLESIPALRGVQHGRDVYLFQPYYGLDSNFTMQYQNEVKKLAAATGGSLQVLKTTRATIDAVAAAVESSGVVIFDSHGSTNYENPWNEEDLVSGATTSYLLLQTCTGLTTEDYAKDGDTYHAMYMGKGYRNMKYCAVDGTCIANHMTKSAPDSLIWSAICLGMATDGLCAPLRAEGVSVFYGYSQSVTFDYDYKWEEVFFARLRAGDTVAQAVAQMKTEVGQWDRCSEYLTIESARRNYCAFPIVSSALDTYPGKGKVDALQEVYSDWQLFGKAKFTVTAVSANTALGTVVPLNDLMFEAKPAENAAVSGWSLQPEGAAAVTQDGNVFTVSDVRED